MSLLLPSDVRSTANLTFSPPILLVVWSHIISLVIVMLVII